MLTYVSNIIIIIQNYVGPPTRKCKLQCNWIGKLVILKISKSVILGYLIVYCTLKTCFVLFFSLLFCIVWFVH